ncbi:MAG TPA: hypothetical protein VN255_00420 [Mycobacterium sp.]|nr:hypothetical protein [Mycobacterium sp.]
MADYNSKTMARKKVREAQQKVRDERELRERANIEDMATFLVSRTRLAGVDQWEADRVAQVSAEASRRREEHRAAAAVAVARIRARGESIAAIARLAETTVSDVRTYVKLAAARGVQSAIVESASEALGSTVGEAANAGDADTETVGLRA